MESDDIAAEIDLLFEEIQKEIGNVGLRVSNLNRIVVLVDTLHDRSRKDLLYDALEILHKLSTIVEDESDLKFKIDLFLLSNNIGIFKDKTAYDSIIKITYERYRHNDT